MVYDLRGQKVKTLDNGFRNRGTYSIEWAGKNESGESGPSGIYLYRLTASNFTTGKKLIYLKQDYNGAHKKETTDNFSKYY